jgi:hypothetical protein
MRLTIKLIEQFNKEILGCDMYALKLTANILFKLEKKITGILKYLICLDN